MGPYIEFIAGNEAIELEHNWLPIEKPAVTERKDNRWNCERPDDKVNAHVPAWMDWLSLTMKTQEEDDGIVEERQKYLEIHRLAKSASSSSMAFCFCEKSLCNPRCFNSRSYFGRQTARSQRDMIRTHRCQGHPIHPVVASIVPLRLISSDSKQYHCQESKESRHRAQTELDGPPSIILTQRSARLWSDGETSHIEMIEADVHRMMKLSTRKAWTGEGRRLRTACL